MSTETFANRAVIITGASSGIGKALALRLAEEGAWLALAARSAERLTALAEDCRARGGRAVPLPTDVAEEAQCQALVRDALAAYGQLDMLVNNAGFGVGSKLEDLPDLRLFNQVMAVNFAGAVACAYFALPPLKAARGRIVNVSSMGGKLALPFNTAYIASKFALNGFSDALRMEVADAGVSVTVICPHWVVTEFHERQLDRDGRPRGPAGRALYTPRMMTAAECAHRIVEAARRRRREVVMGPGRWAIWLRLLAPALVDRLTMDVFLRPAGRRIARAAARR